MSKYLKDNKDKHYYFIDNTKKEWEFLEIRGSNQTYYFKCSTVIYKTFSMIKRDYKDKILKLIKYIAEEYYNHSYYIINKCPKY